MRWNRRLFAGLFLLVALITLTYLNHFDNSFHFDDSHTIVENPYIRNLSNIGAFFRDARTFSAQPANRVYRPVVTTSLAVDYAIAGGLKPFYFHLSTFVWFIAQIVLMWALFRALADAAQSGPMNPWIALCAAGLYAAHPAIAETVNYIIQRGDLYSTLGVVAALAFYVLAPQYRQRGIYLLPLVLAILSKPPALVFPAILFAYLRLFEEKKTARAAVLCAPALVVAAGCGWLVHTMTPATFAPTSGSAYAYRITQPFVALRYFSTFFVPTRLNADTDFTAATSVFERGAWVGFVFVIVLIGAAAWCSLRREWAPAAFGLWWFLLALVPTAVFPLAEVENDHRMYFPFVGLAWTCCWAGARLAASLMPMKFPLKAAAAAVLIVVFSASGAATWQRNEVWRSEESLWFDVTRKSPANGRGLMNYGLTQMTKGEYERALDYFNRAALFTPAYYVLEINLGIAHGSLHHDAEAEARFRRALQLMPSAAESHFFFARWLREKQRIGDAAAHLEQAIALNPDHLSARYLLMNIHADQADWSSLGVAADRTLERFPDDPTAAQFKTRAAAPPAPQTPEDYLNLSLQRHRAGRYEECIAAAREALKLRPDYAEAYNNIAAAYEELQQWDSAIEAARQAVKIRPDFELARNNLAWAESQKKLQEKNK